MYDDKNIYTSSKSICSRKTLCAISTSVQLPFPSRQQQSRNFGDHHIRDFSLHIFERLSLLLAQFLAGEDAFCQIVCFLLGGLLRFSLCSLGSLLFLLLA